MLSLLNKSAIILILSTIVTLSKAKTKNLTLQKQLSSKIKLSKVLEIAQLMIYQRYQGLNKKVK